MQKNRQPRRQNIPIHPSTSLHTVQTLKFIQQYLHLKMLHNINLNAASVQNVLPFRQQQQESYDVLQDVPYVQSQHFDSNHTFEERKQSVQNFTDEEEEEKSISLEVAKRKIVITLDEDEESQFNPDDYQFVSSDASLQKNLTTVHESIQDNKQPQFQEEISLYRLQQTAHFSQAEPISLDFTQSKKSSKENQSSHLNQPKKQVKGCEISRKAMFLNKIEKQKSRKEIVEVINRERHHIKKFLK